MNTKTSQRGFTIIEIIIAVVVIGIIGAVGWVFITQMNKQSPQNNNSQKQTAKSEQATADVCVDASVSADNGTFCAADVGLRFTVPDAFKGKVKKIDNYNVMTQNTVNDQPKVFGKSEVAYEATLQSKNDTYSLTIAKEPLRNFKPKSYTPAFFNKDTKLMRYDFSGQTGEVESTILSATKFYTYGTGDAGTLSSIYTAIVEDEIVVVSLYTKQELGDPATRNYLFESQKLIDEFNAKTKASLKVV